MKLLKDSKRALLKPHLLSVEDLSIPEVDILLNKANFYADANKQKGKIEKTLKRSTVITLFFETSTRTKTSFELAAKRLGANSIGINASASAIKKGETLIDTAMTLNAMHADVLKQIPLALINQEMTCLHGSLNFINKISQNRN